MKKCVFVLMAMLVFPAFAHASTLIGISLGLPSAKGEKSDEVYSGGTSYSFIFGINGTGNFSFESGYTQLIDIEDKFADGQKLESSISGIYISGRYTRQFGENSFGYAKLGAYRWSAKVTENSSSSSNGIVLSSGDHSHNVDGYAPMFALGADFLVGDGSDFGVRVEFEHITDIGGGAKLESPERERNISEGYGYSRFALGVIMAL